MSAEGRAGAVFLSYASQDAAVARRIAEALRAVGVEVWFDQNELVGGDAWDAKIRRQIAECALFVPVISANTQARREGYFRLEWRLAAQRTHMMSDSVAFLLPVVVDATRDAEADVPGEFKAVQWTRLQRGGSIPVRADRESGVEAPVPPDDGGSALDETGMAAFCARVRALLGDAAAGAEGGLRSALESRATAAPPGQPRRAAAGPRRIVVAAAAVIGLAVLAAGAYFGLRSRPERAGPATPAQQVVQRAQKVLDGGDELNRENYYFAEDLLKRAVDLDPAEPSAWALHAMLSYQMSWHSIDGSPKRLDATRRQAERAHSLAPDSPDVQIAWANARILLRQDLPQVERDLEALARRTPADWRVSRALGTLYRYLGRRDDAHQAFRRARELAGGLPMADADLVNALVRSQRQAEAERVLAESLARRSSGRLLTFDVMLRSEWRGDLAGARAALAAWPDWLLAEDRGAALAWRTLFWAGQHEEALAVARRVQRDYLRDTFFSGPRAVLTARAHEAAGHAEAAREDWRLVLEAVERELATTQAAPAASYWKAWALARLGDFAAAQVVCTQMQQRGQLSYREARSSNQLIVATYFQAPGAAPLWATVGRADLALAELSQPAVINDLLPVSRAMLEFDPAFDPLRADPRFQDVLARAPGAEGKPAPARSGGETKSPQTSVVVLPFANLSGDPAQEYVSDGLTEEVLNALARERDLRVPGRASAFSFKGRNLPAAEVAKALNVTRLVEGSYRRSGNRVRISVSLTRAEDGFSEELGTFTDEVSDLFALQEKVAAEVVAKLTGRASTRGRDAPTRNSAAYDAYFRGRFFYAQTSAEGMERAVGYFEEAVRLDPHFAAAWASLARARIWQGSFVATDLRFYRAAENAVKEALKSGPLLAAAHSAQSQLMQRHYFDWRQARAASARAVQLAPDDVEVLTDALCTGVIFGEWERGLAAGRRAVGLDPLNAEIRLYLAVSLFYSGALREAEAEIRQAIALAPAAIWVRMIGVQILLAQGRVEEALALARQEPARMHQLEGIALAEFAAGRVAESDAALKALESEFADQCPFQIAEVYAQRGDADGAFRWLEHAWKVRETGVTLVRTAPTLRALHKDPRWPELLRRFGLSNSEFPWQP